jgi:hypothetical protein
MPCVKSCAKYYTVSEQVQHLDGGAAAAKLYRIRWLGHTSRIPENILSKKLMFDEVERLLDQ